MNKLEFGERLAALDEALPSQKGPMTKARSAIYWEALSDLTDAQLRRSFVRALRECKFFPAPAELRELAGANPDKAMIEAVAIKSWEAVRYAMDRYDGGTSVNFGRLINGVIQALGGWEWLCDQGERDLVFVRKDFIKTLMLFAERGEGGPPALMGRYERENREKGYWPPPPGDPHGLTGTCATVNVAVRALAPVEEKKALEG